MPHPSIIGVDVGGTHTDACVVLLGSSPRVASSAKRPTTADVTSGVIAAVTAALGASPDSTPPSSVQYVAVGTTAFVNALVQRSAELERVGVVRLCGPSTRAMPPFFGFPDDLRAAVDGGSAMVDGGFEFDSKPIAPLDEEAVLEAGRSFAAAGVRAAAVSGVFSPARPEQERRAAELLRSVMGEGVRVTCSAAVGGLGLLPRENAAILNASLGALARRTVEGLRASLAGCGLGACRLYLTLNDGTLADAADAARFPVRAMSSGPTNSLRGAAWLAACDDAVVVDVGGTTADAGLLVGGFPRQAGTSTDVAGVRCAFAVPDVRAHGLGGGSVIADGGRSVGPRSVGFRLAEDAMCFGGGVATATCAAVARRGVAAVLPREETSGRARLPAGLPPAVAEEAERTVLSMLADVVDAARSSAEDRPVVLLVGGGACLVPEGASVAGAARLVRPPGHDVANAVGAALAQVCGVAERVVDLDAAGGHDAAVDALKAEAVAEAERRGAIPGTATVVSVDETPLSYMPGRRARVAVRALGDLQRVPRPEPPAPAAGAAATVVGRSRGRVQRVPLHEPAVAAGGPSVFETFRRVRGGDVWTLSEEDVRSIAVGASILGCGGGGDAFFGEGRLLAAVRAGRPPRVVSPEEFASSGGVCVPVAYMGAPSVITERLPAGTEVASAVSGLERLTGAKADAVLVAEIGGLNGVEPLITASAMGVPVVDADLMGRAFPRLDNTSLSAAGLVSTPACLADDKGQRVAVEGNARTSGALLESIMRSAVVGMGAVAALALRPLSGHEEVVGATCPGSLSVAWRLGDAAREAAAAHRDPVRAVVSACGGRGRVLFRGKITGVDRDTAEGFNRGTVTVEGYDEDPPADAAGGGALEITFQNEFLVARLAAGGRAPVLACTPDIIAVLDEDTGRAHTTDAVRFGLRVAVVALPCHPAMKTPRALEFVGPAAFGLGDGVVYSPL